MNMFIYNKFIKKILATQGLRLTRLTPGRDTMEEACKAIATRGHPIATVVDIGASDGRWSREFMRFYPNSQYLLIEAQPVHEPALQAFCQEHSNSQYSLAAAGNTTGEVYFDDSTPLGGQASRTATSRHKTRVPMTTVDEEIRKRQLRGPYLLKLDTHGFELPILEGASETLKNTEIIIMECYNYPISSESLLFHEMVAHLHSLGFRVVDLADPLFRPYDDTLWQLDLFFVRADWPGLQYLDFK
ncbi:MAG: FkbM family methyltransferase [Anaerolineae bacterium]|nr:MAG: FkbM family methyltransferase [Anaerolineae bacterium]